MFKNMVPLDPAIHSYKKLIKPIDFRFASSIDVVPIGFSEIIPASMWYPLFFAKQRDSWGVFVFLGAERKNIFINKDGSWKVNVIPNIIQIYPFGIQQEQEDEFIVLVDEDFLSDVEGNLLFEGDIPTPFLEDIKNTLTNIAKDLKQISMYIEEIAQEGLLAPLNLYHEFSFGKINLKNAFTANIKGLFRIKPEKLYHLNSKGILALLFAQNLSIRNFSLFELHYSYEGKIF